jgi:hypothetical protein
VRRSITCGRAKRGDRLEMCAETEKRRARTSQLGHPRPVCYTLGVGWFPASEPRCAELLQVQIHGSRRVFLPLFPEARGNFLALAGNGEACHDGCDGYETDTQGADSASRVEGGTRRVGRGATDNQGTLRADFPVE